MTVASIQTGIELNDYFSGVLYSITNAVNLTISSMEDMQQTMSADVDTSSFQDARDEISQATMALDQLSAAMQNPLDVQWQTEELDAFTGSGIEQFEQEIQSTNVLLENLNQTQQQIIQTASGMNILPDAAVADITSVGQRLQVLQQQIQQISSNPLNLGMDEVNGELARLRNQLNQAVQAQNDLNGAVQDMDVGAANDAHIRLSQTISSTERYIRDNINEQGRFNREIQNGVEYAGSLEGKISGAVGAFIGLVGIRKVIGFIQDTTAAFDRQMNAENQLRVVLGNMLDSDYVSQFEIETTADTTDAINEINAIQGDVGGVVVPVSASTQALQAEFNAITDKAADIQSRGIYGDEAMIAGAAEFATYFKDTDAITTMMDTLSDYAMGMSGGGAIDSTAMVDYATGLGKIMTGSYDAMTKKGFEFSDAQKAVIEGTASQAQLVDVLGDDYSSMTSDMQAAAAISQVIEESWGGIYETMSDTPQGKIIQLTNAWGDMEEVIGGKLYPYVLLFVDAINDNWGTISSIVDGITTGLQFLMGVLSWILEGAINVAGVIVDNWSWISPIIYGIAGALAVYYGWLLLTRGLEISAIVVKGGLAVAEGIHAAAVWLTTSATWAQTTAQLGLNAALYACPIVWILIVIIGLIAAIYGAVAAINYFAQTSISATGLIVGAFMVAGAFIANQIIMLINFVIDCFVFLWNYIATFANFFGNVFNDPVGAIARLFFDLADNVLEILQALASAIDTIFGSNLAGSVQGWRNSLGGWVDKTFGAGEEIMSKIDPATMHLKRFEYGSMFDMGYNFGKGIEDTLGDLLNLDNLFNVDGIPSPDDYMNGPAGGVGGIGDDVSDIAGNTGAMANSMDITSEELKYLRDLAEQETVNWFTTAEITIEQTNNNNISKDTDLDGVVSSLTDAVNEAVDIITEGVHN